MAAALIKMLHTEATFTSRLVTCLSMIAPKLCHNKTKPYLYGFGQKDYKHKPGSLSDKLELVMQGLIYSIMIPKF